MKKMDNTEKSKSFTLFETKNGVEWWQCKKCKYLSRGETEVCPVCHGYCNNSETPEINTDKAFDKIIQQYKDLLDKYGCNTSVD
ncbi:hypothetical protein [Ruminococcus flavefaciens]|uniref:hypothetical protein n=1 Tax=Ruminococcus flavefaciens TaxID=1265 RepID=UPI0026F0ED86|nr:hypothetical protein [Ruminococcus flavefaciens]